MPRYLARSPHFPSILDLGEHKIVGIVEVPVDEGPNLIRLARTPRYDFQVSCELVRGESSDALLAEDAPPTAGYLPPLANLGAGCRLHPSPKQRLNVHAHAIVNYLDLTLIAGHIAEPHAHV